MFLRYRDLPDENNLNKFRGETESLKTVLNESHKLFALKSSVCIL